MSNMPDALTTVLEALSQLVAERIAQHRVPDVTPLQPGELPDFDAAMLQLAELQEAVTANNAALEAIAGMINDAFMDNLRATMLRNGVQLGAYEAGLRSCAMNYFDHTGETPPTTDNLIQIRRSSTIMYDENHALSWARVNAPEVIRVKESLDKVAFKKLAADGTYPDAEPVHSVQVALTQRLGHLLIKRDVEAKDDE